MFKIISSISETPLLNKYWIISMDRLVNTMKRKYLEYDIFEVNSQINAKGNGININILPNTSMKKSTCLVKSLALHVLRFGSLSFKG